jgi:pyrrolidone-carboxylate peptidase
MSTDQVHVELFITSFGPFRNVPHNPSEGVMHGVTAALAGGKHAGIVLAGANVLDVTTTAVDEYLTTHAALPPPRSKHTVRLFVHLGVHSRGRRTLFMERRAQNDVFDGVSAQRRILDDALLEAEAAVLDGQAGGAPPPATSVAQKQSIDDSDKAAGNQGAGGDQLTSTSALSLSLSALQTAVRLGGDAAHDASKDAAIVAACLAHQAQFPEMIPSVNAGTYLCNYLMYSSLQRLASPELVRYTRAGAAEADVLRCTHAFHRVDGGTTRGRLCDHGAVASLFLHILPTAPLDGDSQEAVDGDFFPVGVQAVSVVAFLERFVAALV